MTESHNPQVGRRPVPTRTCPPWRRPSCPVAVRAEAEAPSDIREPVHLLYIYRHADRARATLDIHRTTEKKRFSRKPETVLATEIGGQEEDQGVEGVKDAVAQPQASLACKTEQSRMVRHIGTPKYLIAFLGRERKVWATQLGGLRVPPSAAICRRGPGLAWSYLIPGLTSVWLAVTAARSSQRFVQLWCANVGRSSASAELPAECSSFSGPGPLRPGGVRALAAGGGGADKALAMFLLGALLTVFRQSEALAESSRNHSSQNGLTKIQPPTFAVDHASACGTVSNGRREPGVAQGTGDLGDVPSYRHVTGNRVEPSRSLPIR